MIEQETLLGEYMRSQCATYTTLPWQCDKKTISSPDNKAYMLASPNNKQDSSHGNENNSEEKTITDYSKAVA